MANLAGPEMHNKYGIVEGAQYCNQNDRVKMYLNNTWEPNLSVTGADGLPPVGLAGNVVRANTSLRFSMRLPPSMNAKDAEAIMRKKLTEDVPYGAKVSIGGGHAGSGWCMKELTPDLM